jgi:glycosyltransferase involved in cell wall biosynthesis
MAEQIQKCIVSYQIATYSGEEIVYCDPNDDDETVIEIAKSQIRRKAGGSLPQGYQSFQIIEREDYFED